MLILSYCLKTSRLLLLDFLSVSVSFVIALISYITSLRFKIKMDQKHRELDYYGSIDPLTRVLNKGAFERKYTFLTSRIADGALIALSIMDIDNFKAINDSLGHIAGDELLCSFSQTLRSCFSDGRNKIITGRFGGDEFMICMLGFERPEVEAMLRKFLSALSSVGTERRPALRCSVGTALTTDRSRKFNSLLSIADKALYTAKAAGGNTLRITEID